MTVRTGQDHFFPTTFDVQAVPIPLEQLDAAIQASASLAPFSASTPDQASILVPVPQQWYEPALLQVEQVNPEFQTTLDQLVITPWALADPAPGPAQQGRRAGAGDQRPDAHVPEPRS